MVNNKKKNGTKGAKGTKGASDNGKMGKNKDAKSDLSQLTPDITDLIRNYFPRDAANIEKNWTLFEEKSKRQHFDECFDGGKLECKNWIKTSKKKDTGSIYFIVKEDDDDEMKTFKKRKGIDGKIKYKILALKLLACYIYVGKRKAKGKRWSGHLTAESTPIDKFLLNRRLKGFKDVCINVNPYKKCKFFEVFESLVINELRNVMKKPLNVDFGFDVTTQINGFDSEEFWCVLCGIFVCAVKSPTKIQYTMDEHLAKTRASIPEVTRVFIDFYQKVKNAASLHR